MSNKNILMADGYKYSHWAQYPDNTEFVSSYIEARGFSAPFAAPPEVVLFGVGAYLKDYLSTPFTRQDLEEVRDTVEPYGLPFNTQGWNDLFDKYGGFMPVFVQSLPEGTVAPTGTPLVQIQNTDKQFPWITSFLETNLLRPVWYGTTVATVSREIKKDIKHYLELTADSLDGLPFKLHDFGQRGVSSGDSAGLGGLAHLVNFQGTDTVEALFAGKRYYDAKGIGFSIPASEHSTMTIFGPAGEEQQMKRMLDKFGSKGLVSVVSDSYDLHKAVADIFGGSLKEQIKTMGGTLVVRPDSGDPLKETLAVIEILGEKFGFTTNSKGYKMLPNYLRIIQGDGINQQSIRGILDRFMRHGWSADNIAFGMGGELLQQVNRDSLKFAMKASQAIIGGVEYDIQKDPITDHGKKSKAGRQAVVRRNDGKLTAIREKQLDGQNMMKTVYFMDSRGPHFVNKQSFDEIRENAKL